MSNVLIDTHVLAWSLVSPSQLTSEARRKLEGGATVHVPPCTLHEIALNVHKGKWPEMAPCAGTLDNLCLAQGIRVAQFTGRMTILARLRQFDFQTCFVSTACGARENPCHYTAARPGSFWRAPDEVQANVPASSSSIRRTAFGSLTPTHWAILPATPTAARGLAPVVRERRSARSPSSFFPLFPAVAGASCWLGPFLVAGDGHGNDGGKEGMLMLHGNVFGIGGAGESGSGAFPRERLRHPQ